MTKQLIWGYSWLCLCLVFIALTVSCTVKRQAKAVNNEFNWEVRAWVKAQDLTWNIPVNDSTMITPFAVKRLINGNQFDTIVISYRLNNMTQVLFVKQKLMETGFAENIVVMNYNH